jgi:hypothetical protein
MFSSPCQLPIFSAGTTSGGFSFCCPWSIFSPSSASLVKALLVEPQPLEEHLHVGVGVLHIPGARRVSGSGKWGLVWPVNDIFTLRSTDVCLTATLLNFTTGDFSDIVSRCHIRWIQFLVPFIYIFMSSASLVKALLVEPQLLEEHLHVGVGIWSFSTSMKLRGLVGVWSASRLPNRF